MSGTKKDEKVNQHAYPAHGGKATVEDAISRQLRDYYDSVAEEPIPDRFIDLLEKLDQAELASRTKDEDGGDDA